jgi:YfiH family protein
VPPSSLAGWRLDRLGGIEVVRCTALLAPCGVGHGFSTRSGAAGLLAAAGLAGRQEAAPRQVHGATLVRATAVAEAAGPVEADGVLALRDRESRHAPTVCWADCVPLLLADRRGRAVAAVHAGWRGTSRGVAAAAVAGLEREGVEPADLVAAIGPCIGPCCYRVGPEVLAAVAQATGVAPDALAAGDEKAVTLDLRRANLLQLDRAGVPKASIHISPWCTHCEEELFFSFRREGRVAGRQMASIGWLSGP